MHCLRMQRGYQLGYSLSSINQNNMEFKCSRCNVDFDGALRDNYENTVG